MTRLRGTPAPVTVAERLKEALPGTANIGRAAGDKLWRNDLIARVAKRAGVSFKTADDMYDALVAEILVAMLNGQEVNLRGFGRFYPQMHAGGQGRGMTSSLAGGARERLLLKFSASRSIHEYLTAHLDNPAGVSAKVPGIKVPLVEEPVEETRRERVKRTKQTKSEPTIEHGPAFDELRETLRGITVDGPAEE